MKSFQPKANLVCTQTTAWFILAESKLQPNTRYEQSTPQALEVRNTILIKGICLASRVSSLVKTCLTAHMTLEMPLNKTLFGSITTLLEALKGIEFTFIRKDLVIAEGHSHTIRILANSLFQTLKPFRAKLESVRKLEASRADMKSCIEILDAMLAGTEQLSYVRQSVLVTIAEILSGSSLSDAKEMQKIKQIIRRMSLASSIGPMIKAACDTSFLVFHYQLLSPMIAAVYQEPTSATRLQYIVAAFSDSIKLCQMILHVDPVPFFQNLRKHMHTVLKEQIIEPLSRDIETDLRLHVHTKHLDHMQAVNPKTENLRIIRPFLDLPAVRVLGLMIDIKREVTHYLDTNFYNLTVLALHDWRTYSEMRSLAAEKLGIVLLDNFLPMGSLDQGLDVLQIMRNIHIFVGRFTYNMNMQEFVEFKPDKSSKHLNTIKIQSIAASIRQHGLGMLNTTVNFTYQFLTQQFHIFTEFLYDDNIRSPLSREHRWFKKHKNDPDVNNMYVTFLLDNINYLDFNMINSFIHVCSLQVSLRKSCKVY